MYDFTPAPDDDEGLPVHVGEVLEFKEESEDGDWVLVSRPGGEQGFVPKTYLEKYG